MNLDRYSDLCVFGKGQKDAHRVAEGVRGREERQHGALDQEDNYCYYCYY